MTRGLLSTDRRASSVPDASFPKEWQRCRCQRHSPRVDTFPDPLTRARQISHQTPNVAREPELFYSVAKSVHDWEMLAWPTVVDEFIGQNTF